MDNKDQPGSDLELQDYERRGIVVDTDVEITRDSNKARRASLQARYVRGTILSGVKVN
jgi:hypothetical protein